MIEFEFTALFKISLKTNTPEPRADPENFGEGMQF